jgi:hypothetical protein
VIADATVAGEGRRQKDGQDQDEKPISFHLHPPWEAFIRSFRRTFLQEPYQNKDRIDKPYATYLILTF